MRPNMEPCGTPIITCDHKLKASQVLFFGVDFKGDFK